MTNTPTPLVPADLEGLEKRARDCIEHSWVNVEPRAAFSAETVLKLIEALSRLRAAELEADHQRRCAQEWFDRLTASEERERLSREALERISSLKDGDVLKAARNLRLAKVIAEKARASLRLQPEGEKG